MPVLVFPRLFFPLADPASATLSSLATFGVAFVARPVGSLLFGHFSDRRGRKTTLVLALLCMGLSTFLIGALPGYDRIGLAAPVLLAVENAPPHRRALHGMFPQLSAPIGFLFSGGVFLLISWWPTEAQCFAWEWRMPFLASVGLVLIGLHVRPKIMETPVFQAAIRRTGQVNAPALDVFRRHWRPFVVGVLVCQATFVPLGTMVAEFFPTPVRYTGSSLAFCTADILDASLAPYIATRLAQNRGLPWVGCYLTASALLTLVDLLMSHETRDDDLSGEAATVDCLWQAQAPVVSTMRKRALAAIIFS